ncbi:TonB-dependent receptor [Escherichia coli]|uniref:TonB-dependent receptor n=1 Tax=Escherichia coli TaxID=562 RepID=A0A376MYD8_ECOLX|nr:TonB-dependent receptor [Escherichia coli]
MIVSAAPQVVSELDTPAAVSVVDGEEMRLATPRINLSESLTSVPGLQVQNRQNYAQDLQLSIRGLAPAPLTEFAVFACMLTVFPLPCPTDKGRHPISI